MDHKIKNLNGLALAFLGDSIWDLYVREHFLLKGHPIGVLNEKTKQYVNCKYQSSLFLTMKDNLTGIYKETAFRARNCNIKTFSKNCSQQEYRNSTAFEALIAVYYLKNENDKIKNIINNCIF